MGVSMLGVSIPNFVAGPLLILVFSLFLIRAGRRTRRANMR